MYYTLVLFIHLNLFNAFPLMVVQSPASDCQSRATTITRGSTSTVQLLALCIPTLGVR